MSEPMILPRNCGNCQHFDGDYYCALPYAALLIRSSIIDANRVVCEKHEPKDANDVEGAAV